MTATRHVLTTIILAGLLFLLCPSVCLADAGIPSIAVAGGLGVMVLAFFLVVMIETYVFSQELTLYSYFETLFPVTRANMISALAGIPFAIAYSLLHTSDELELSSTWQPVLSLITLPIAFVISVHIEYHVVKGHFTISDHSLLKRLSWRANSITYLLLAAIVITTIARP